MALNLGYSSVPEVCEALSLMRLPVIALLLLSATSPAWAGETAGAARLDFSRVGWQQVVLRLSKLFLSSTAQIELLRADADNLGLLAADQGQPVMPGDSVVQLDTRTELFGRESFIRLLMDPVTAAALQYEAHDQGSRYRHRFFRFTSTGTLVKTYRPAEKKFDVEKERPWREWSSVEEEFRRFPPAAEGLIITDPLGLIYIASAANLSPGDPPLEVFTLSGRIITRVYLTPRERSRRDIDFTLHTAGRESDCEGKIEVQHLELSAGPLKPGGEFELEFLGLQDDIQLYVETTTRMPVEVSGRAKWLGKTHIRLREATLTGKSGCPAR